jgi:hypothetical protein
MKMSVNMRMVSIICCFALVAVNVSSLLTELSLFHSYFLGASLIVALALLVIVIVSRGERPEPEPPKADAAKPIPVPAPGNQAETEIVSFLGLLQERGRLVDFLMEDITSYDDAQVGAAARVVHQGCKAVCASTSKFDRCAKRTRDHLSLLPWGMQPMSIVWSGTSGEQDRSRGRSSIAGGKPSG